MADTFGVTRLMLNEDLRRLDLNSTATFTPDIQTFFIPTQEPLLYLYKYDVGVRLAVRLPFQPATAEDFYAAANHIKHYGGVYHLHNKEMLAIDTNDSYFDLLNDAAQAGHTLSENVLIAAIIANNPSALRHLVHKEEVTYLIPHTSMSVKVMLPKKCVTQQEIHQLGKDLLLASKNNAGKDGCHNHYFIVKANVKITGLLGLALIDKARKMSQINMDDAPVRRRTQAVEAAFVTTTLPRAANTLPPAYPPPFVLFQQEDRKHDELEMTQTFSPSPRL